MGQAKQRKMAGATVDPRLVKELGRVASAVRRICSASSSRLGSDCALHASLSAELLLRLGWEARVVAGFAGWRVGEGHGDVILHAPMPDMPPPKPNELPFHVWIEVGNFLFDPTTYQLRQKAAELDALDGQTTIVNWCPDYLAVHRDTLFSLRSVRTGSSGTYYYQREQLVEGKVFGSCFGADPEDVELAWFLYHQQDVAVLGRNHFLQACR